MACAVSFPTPPCLMRVCACECRDRLVNKIKPLTELTLLTHNTFLLTYTSQPPIDTMSACVCQTNYKLYLMDEGHTHVLMRR